MYKLIILFAVLAFAAATPGLLGLGGVVSPLAYAAAPLAVPAPYAYAAGYRVAYRPEPVEQHGYTIAY